MSKRTAIALSVAMCVFSTGSGAQPTLDIVGIKLNMTPGEVTAAIKAHQPKMKIETQPYQYRSQLSELPKSTAFMHGDYEPGVHDEVWITFHPFTQRSVLIERRYAHAKERPSFSELTGALQAKYGSPSLSDLKSTVPTFRWGFDDKGQRLQLPESVAVLCGRLAHHRTGQWWMAKPPFNEDVERIKAGACGRMLVSAVIGVDKELVGVYSVGLADLGTLVTIEPEVRTKLDDMDKAELDRRAKGTGAPKPKL